MRECSPQVATPKGNSTLRCVRSAATPLTRRSCPRARLRRSIGTALAAFYPGFEEEVIEEQTGYSLDLALRSARLAIEVDGPSHYLRDPSDERVPNGPTLLKRWLLKASGWRVASVPFYEWDALAGPCDQRAYLERLLRGVGLASLRICETEV